jgi:hypothetical protein
MAGKSTKEFTAQDMKKAFEFGEKVGGGSWALQRWMRNQYPSRYVRRTKAEIAQATKAGK